MFTLVVFKESEREETYEMWPFSKSNTWLDLENGEGVVVLLGQEGVDCGKEAGIKLSAAAISSPSISFRARKTTNQQVAAQGNLSVIDVCVCPAQ